MFPGPQLLHLRLALAAAGLFLASLIVSISPAYADLRVCNETSNPVSIALGYRADKGWQSEGWWVAPPTKCATVYQGDLNSRFFYLYVADDIGGGAWDGKVFMCTRDETFTIFGVEDCLARGYERTGFFEVDTRNRSDWMLQLTDNGTSSGQDTGNDATDDITVPIDGDQPPADDTSGADQQGAGGDINAEGAGSE